MMISFGLRWLESKEMRKISKLKEMFQSEYVRQGFWAWSSLGTFNRHMVATLKPHYWLCKWDSLCITWIHVFCTFTERTRKYVGSIFKWTMPRIILTYTENREEVREKEKVGSPVSFRRAPGTWGFAFHRQIQVHPSNTQGADRGDRRMQASQVPSKARKDLRIKVKHRLSP